MLIGSIIDFAAYLSLFLLFFSGICFFCYMWLREK